MVGAACMLLLAGLGLLSGWRDDRRRTFVLAVVALGVPLVAMLLAMSWSRAGFTWNYILPSAAPMAVLAARGVGPGLRRALAAYGLGTMVWLVGLHLASRGTEDFPGAVRRILELHEPGDAVVSVELQPPFFSQGLPWDYYAPRLSEAPPPRLEMRGVDVADPSALGGARRVLVLVSKLPANTGVRRRLEARRGLALEEDFGFGRRVMLFE